MRNIFLRLDWIEKVFRKCYVQMIAQLDDEILLRAIFVLKGKDLTFLHWDMMFCDFKLARS